MDGRVETDYSDDSRDESLRQRGRKHVFVVNGSPDFLNMMRELLQDERYNVTTTNFVPSIADMIVAAAPDAVVVDLIAHQLSGWDLLGSLRASDLPSHVPILIVSTSEPALEKARQDPALSGDRFLLKPAGVEEIITAVGELIGPA
jgi:DNA-binding response OmpR family regulator